MSSAVVKIYPFCNIFSNKFVYSISWKKWYWTNIIWEFTEILTAARILVGISEFIQASTNSSICDPERKVLILPVIPGGMASLIPPGIKCGIPPRIGGISPGINGGIPPGTFHNPSRDPRWDPTWDEHGIPGGIRGIPHLILTWVFHIFVNSYRLFSLEYVGYK